VALDCFAELIIGPAFGRTRWLAMTNFDQLLPGALASTPRIDWPTVS
jgi:hypothetical protein